MYILFSQSKPGYSKQKVSLQAFFITEKEAVNMAENMRDHERDKYRAKNHIWICTRKGLLFAGEPPEGSILKSSQQPSKEVAEILEQSWFFSGDIYWLALKAQHSELYWLSKDRSDVEMKLKFFEKYILALHPESIEIYQRYKELFISKQKEDVKKSEKEEIVVQDSGESDEREYRVKIKKFR